MVPSEHGLSCPECGGSIGLIDNPAGPEQLYNCLFCAWEGTEPCEESDDDDDYYYEDYEYPEDTYKIERGHDGPPTYYTEAEYACESIENYTACVLDAYSEVRGTGSSVEIWFKGDDGEWNHTATITGSGD